MHLLVFEKAAENGKNGKATGSAAKSAPESSEAKQGADEKKSKA